ncbi:MAG: terminase [Nitrosomonadales bacterium]|nr:MAG: terminase [Nitrosomonadales bacterium]
MLEISREDIARDHFQIFPGDKRFLKLSIEKYLNLIDFTPNNPQRAIVNALNNPKYRFITAAIARRLGKTEIANIVGHLVTLIPGTNVLIMSPNYSLSQISFERQVYYLQKTGIEISRSNLKDRIIELANGSTIRLGSVNQVDSVVGRSYDFIIFDEAALTAEGEKAFEQQLRPTLDKPSSKALFISTPRGKNNWFAKFYYRGYSTEYPMWASIKADYRENPRASLEDIAEARKTMSDSLFRQEQEADFSVFEGQIFRFDTDACMEDLSQYPTEGLDIFAGLDIGFRDPTALIVLGYDYNTEKYYALEEYQNSEKTTSMHAEVVTTLIAKYGIETIYIDSSAAQTRFDWAYEYNIPTTAANKSVLDGIAHVQSLVEKNRLIVDSKCINLLATLDQYRWDKNPNLVIQKPEHDMFSHMADALRYGLYSHTTSSGVF